MRTSPAPANNGTEEQDIVGPHSYVDEEHSGDYGAEGIGGFSGSLGDYSGGYGPEAIADFSGSLGDYSGDYGAEGIGGFSGSLGDYSGDYGAEGIGGFSGSLGDYSGDYGAEGIGGFSGSLGDYSGDYGAEGIGGFSGSLGDYSGDYGAEGIGGFSGSGDYGPEGGADYCEDYGPERDTELCGVYGTEDVGPGSTYTPTPQWGSPTFMTPAVFLILSVQLSMVVFLLVRGRKEKTFRQGFYLFFVAVTLAETFTVAVRRDLYALSAFATIFGLPYDVGFPFTRVIDVIVFIFVAPVVAYAQSLLHLAIVTTRLTAFCFPLGHSSVWSRRNVLGVFVVIGALSIPLGVGPPAFFGIRKMAANCLYEQNGQRASAADWFCPFEEELQDVEWQSSSISVFNASFLLVSTVCYLVSFLLSMCSVSMLLVLRATRKLQRNHRGPELRLFVHSLVVFLLQTVMVFQTFIHITDIEVQWFRDFPDSAEWLAGRNVWSDANVLRECHDLNECGLFYGILSGYWVFGYDPNRITVDHMETAARNLTPFAFALCGPLSLLAISANVRNGYFRFYTKCLRWRSKRTHVIHVVSSSSVVSFSAATSSKTSYRANLRGNRLVL